MDIPKNYQHVMPYLILENAAGFIPFALAVFGAKETYKVLRDEKTIMHAEIMIGASTIMFADATEQFPPRNAGLFVYVDNADEAYRKALDAGSTALTPMGDQTYGRSGGIRDPFGNEWWITAPLQPIS
jgi:PhnB protein